MPVPADQVRSRRAARLAAVAGLCAAAAACRGTALPPDLDAVVAQSDSAAPVRLWLDGDRIVAAAVPVGPGGLPAAVRTAADAIAPGGDEVFAAREWGPDGVGFRIEKRYVDDHADSESFRSMLFDRDGAVLERSHSVPTARVPIEILTLALSIGRDLRRCEVVSGPAGERGWRAQVRDGAGRTLVVELDLAGTRLAVHRVVAAELRPAAR